MRRETGSTRTAVPKNRQRSRLRSFVTFCQVMILIGIGASVGIALGLFINLSGAIPTEGDFQAPEATSIYSSDGVLLGRVYREDRTNVNLKDIPKYLRDATIATEDARFYQHSGVDIRGIARALWQNLRGGRLAQGGSTITQQLARNVYLTHQRSLQRKLQEAVLAILIERNYNKDKILELYLNRVYYGSGAFGVQAASKVYFGKDVKDLSLSECALLAGLPQLPSLYSPHVDKKAAFDRRNKVLQLMEEQGYITHDQRVQAKKENIHIVPRVLGRDAYKAPHFVSYVARFIRQRYGDDALHGGGLRVFTTLNWEMQKIAEKALREGVKKHERTRRVTEGCFVCIDPTSGYIRAMVGSVDPKSHWNRCVQGPGRQPGSAFKVFVYAAAFEECGMTPYDRVIDSYISFPVGRKRWAPKNYDNRFHGVVTIKRAIAESINIPAIKVCQKVGVNTVIKYAEMMGITTPLEPYLTIAIGGIRGAHPLDMCSAYGTFANNGVHIDPLAVTRVTDSKGRLIEDFRPEGERVISERTNNYMLECLRAVVTSRRGTGYAVRDVPNAHGKTGTTNDDRDAWFIGFVPGKLVAACWVGNDNYKPMRRAYGGIVCAPIWREFMLNAVPIHDEIQRKYKQYADKTDENRKADKKRNTDRTEKAKDDETKTGEPANAPDQQDESEVVTVRVCNESQFLATSHCPSTHTERFLRGTEPTTYCSIHAGNNVTGQESQREEEIVTVCPDSGMIAGPNCPNPVRRRVSIDKLPDQVCSVHNRSGR